MPPPEMDSPLFSSNPNIMYDLTKYPPEHPLQLWGKTREVLKERVGDSWLLLYGANFNTAGLMKPNVCMMELKFLPKDGEKLGQASIANHISIRWAKAFAEYLSKVPNANLPAPLTDPERQTLDLYDETHRSVDCKAVDIVNMEGSYTVAAVAGIISPMSPDLYGRMAKWYIENAEAITNFMHNAYVWNKKNGEYPMLDD